jgi:hypothetical protein
VNLTSLSAVCAAALLSVTACTSDEPSTPKGQAAVKPSTPATSPETVPHRPLPTKPIPNDVDKRRSVVIEECKATKNGWRARGTATNSADSSETYEITIFFTTTSATVMDFARTTVTVAAGETEKWQASTKFPAPDEVRCVLRGVG